MSNSSFLRTRRAWAMISGPMPSPGRTATFTLEIPGELRFAPRLEAADLVRVAQREADLVEAVQERVLVERLDVEMESLCVIDGRDGLPLQVYSQLEAGKGSGFVEKAVDLRLREHDRQEAVLERVVPEDVAER